MDDSTCPQGVAKSKRNGRPLAPTTHGVTHVKSPKNVIYLKKREGAEGEISLKKIFFKETNTENYLFVCLCFVSFFPV